MLGARWQPLWWNNLSYTPCQDAAISPGVGITLSYTHVAPAPMVSYSSELLSYDNNHHSNNPAQ